jgi:tRNA pseudouridine55 synthase
MQRDNDLSGLLLLNKSPGITSFQALGAVKKAFSTNKVGHTGTLDKFASGLLLVLVGRAVKLASLFDQCDKHYQGIIRFGIETDTLDPEGVSVAEGELPSLEQLQWALPGFRGNILQAPPAYSALHIAGERASALARAGKTVEMQKRPVTIHELELISYRPPEAVIRVHCSKGTYIRSLARDIALAAGSRGHLIALNRTQVAGFFLSDAQGLIDDPPESLTQRLKPIDTEVFEALALPYISIDKEIVYQVIHGKPLAGLIDEGKICLPPTGSPAVLGKAPVLGLFHNNHLIAVVEKNPPPGSAWSYGHVYAST